MAYTYWQDELELIAPGTRRGYLLYFKGFTEWLKVDAEELYQWQKRLLEDGDPRTNREIVLKFVSWYREMQKTKGWAGSTVARASYAVKSFFTANSLVFPIRQRDLPSQNPVGARVVMLDEIKQLWDLVSNENKLRNRAILMMLKDTGLRRGDISKMSVEDYLGSRIIETENGAFRVFNSYKTEKTGEIAYVHLGPETVNAVDHYLEIEGRTSGPLFLDRKMKRLGAGSITAFVQRLATRIQNGEKVSPHSFRKTHRTLLESRIPESYIRKLQGKSTDPYIRPEETGALTKAYIDNYAVLRVFREQVELESIKQELNQYKVASSGQQISQQSEIDLLKTQLSTLQRLFETALEDATGSKLRLDFPIGNNSEPQEEG